MNDNIYLVFIENEEGLTLYTSHKVKQWAEQCADSIKKAGEKNVFIVPVPNNGSSLINKVIKSYKEDK